MYQPLLPSVPVGVSVTFVGAVLSSLKVRDASSVCRPASLVQVPPADWLALSVEKTCGAVHTTGVLIVSAPVVSTVTSLIYQLLLPSVPLVIAPDAEGAVLSSF